MDLFAVLFAEEVQADADSPHQTGMCPSFHTSLSGFAEAYRKAERVRRASAVVRPESSGGCPERDVSASSFIRNTFFPASHCECIGKRRVRAGEKGAIHAGVPLGVKVSPFPASLPFGKEHPFHVGVGEARVGGKFDVPGAADDAEGAFGRAFLGRIAQRAGTGGIAEYRGPVGKFFGMSPMRAALSGRMAEPKPPAR